MKATKIISAILEAESVAEVNIDGYTVNVYPDLEAPGKFFYTVNHNRYTGASKATIAGAIERAKKTVEIRKQVDARQASSQGQAHNLQDQSVARFFAHKKKHGITW